METKLPDSCKNDCVYPNCKCMDKPDFDKEAHDYVLGMNPSTISHDWLISTDFKSGANHVWDKYVKPLQKENERLKAEKDHFYTLYLEKVEQLSKMLKELDNLQETIIVNKIKQNTRNIIDNG